MSDQLRLFVALELPESIRSILADTQSILQSRTTAASAIRWVEPDGVHLTLKFLGEVPALRLNSIQAAITASVAEHASFDIHLHGLGCFPHARRPRVVWAGIKTPNPSLSKLQSDIETALASLGFAPEDRPFHPHLTLGRARRNEPTSKLQQVGELIAQSDLTAEESWHSDGVSLMESILYRTGAEYHRRLFVPFEG